jgi:hypothetical protein
MSSWWWNDAPWGREKVTMLFTHICTAERTRQEPARRLDSYQRWASSTPRLKMESWSRQSTLTRSGVFYRPDGRKIRRIVSWQCGMVIHSRSSTEVFCIAVDRSSLIGWIVFVGFAVAFFTPTSEVYCLPGLGRCMAADAASNTSVIGK